MARAGVVMFGNGLGSAAAAAAAHDRRHGLFPRRCRRLHRLAQVRLLGARQPLWLWREFLLRTAKRRVGLRPVRSRYRHGRASAAATAAGPDPRTNADL